MKKNLLYLVPCLASFLYSCGNLNVPSDKTDFLEVRVRMEVIGGHDGPVLKKGDPGTEDNMYGFEGGTVLKFQNQYHLFTAEMVGDPRWVKMKLGHWISPDGTKWERISTLKESSGDFTGRDYKAAVWSPMPIFNEKEDRWNLFYVGYRSQPDSGGMWLSNYHGRVYRAVSKIKGIDGIDGPYEDVSVILKPGKESDAWEGLQGTDSFFPYMASDGKFYGFYGSAQTQYKHITYWQVGLASSENLAGPWKRRSDLNPIDLGISFTENPVVTRLENGMYVAVVDAGSDSLHFDRSAFGYFWSKDGIHWSKERFCDMEHKVSHWWNWMRTPLSLIKEDDGSFTVFYTAYGKNNFAPLGMLKVKVVTDTIRPLVYKDNRPIATKRMDAEDVGIVLYYGKGPDSCDKYGARDVWVYKANDSTFAMHYDAAGPKGWLATLAVSKDLVHWNTKGPVLQLGKNEDPDSKSASYGTTYYDGKKWHMFYLGTPNATSAPDRIPSFPYLCMKAESKNPFGPWVKRRDIIPFKPKENSFYSSTCSPGTIVKDKEEYLMFFSAADFTVKRTICIARTKDLNASWKVDSLPIVPAEEQIENSSLYYEESNQTWFLFTNHIGHYEDGGEFTDAIWVYWSKDLNKWDPSNKAIVLDGNNCKWSHRCIGLPSVIKYKNRLAIFYDAPGGNSISHMGRSVGIAFLKLPLTAPK